MIVPVIMAGGSGTRLWPLSRELYPKQLIAMYNEQTMLQNTVTRLEGVEGIQSPILICNNVHRFMAAEQMQQIHCKPRDIILEPVGRNTAPAIALAALKLVGDGVDPVMLVLPADHKISQPGAFQKVVEEGVAWSEDGRLITFGIVPNSPETGYGYIRKGEALDQAASTVAIGEFVEKPDLPTAEQYLASGEYCWNSGMFMFKASTILREFEAHAPEMLTACKKAMAAGEQDLDFFRIPKDLFEQVPSDSIDYAIMEKTSKGAMIPLDAGWNDLGSFDALWQTNEKNEDKNVFKGDVLVHDVRNSFVHASSKMVAAVGLDEFVIVETPDAVLVSPRDRVQDIKKLVVQLRDGKRQEAVTHSKVYRPWGDYETIDMADRYQVKRITVKPGAVLSLQKHYHRAEHWTVVSGSALVTKGEDTLLLKEDESVYIPLGTLHRLENPGKIPLELIEVQSGSYLGEDDIVRYEDVYGRRENQSSKD
ncbi:MAG: mannose-1-phosphate guanylyltransferase/mannose-6-phosphate isomerase [Desulfobacterales bacterium]|nr:mannose-1-phosphate guanylyltransferase/mannose-6-phosphate isomerase [Desulfobacterales bacterium]